MVIVMALAALNATTVLIHDLIVGSPSTKSGSTLLAAGGAVWAINVVAFALLYREFDSGGAATRAHGMPSTPDFAFPQQLDPEIAPRWRPRFVDYLYVGITDAVAFSPTDAMPLAPWAKLAIALEAMVSFVIIGLVIARAVNVLK